MTTKRIEYSYPTSPNATRFGLRDGGYTVELLAHASAIPKAIAGFKTLAEAKAYANQMPEPWNRLTR